MTAKCDSRAAHPDEENLKHLSPFAGRAFRLYAINELPSSRNQ